MCFIVQHGTLPRPVRVADPDCRITGAPDSRQRYLGAPPVSDAPIITTAHWPNVHLVIGPPSAQHHGCNFRERPVPTIMTHAAIPLCLGIAAGRKIVPTKIVIAGMVLAMLPDADVIGLSMGIPYEADWGHRGASHSIAIAFAVSAALIALLKPPRAFVTFLFLWLAMASHGLLDMLTSGGLGPAIWWPWSGERIFAQVRPILVSPIGVEAFISQRGLAVLWSEAKWDWVPAISLAAVIWGSRTALRWQSKPIPTS